MKKPTIVDVNYDVSITVNESPALMNWELADYLLTNGVCCCTRLSRSSYLSWAIVYVVRFGHHTDIDLNVARIGLWRSPCTTVYPDQDRNRRKVKEHCGLCFLQITVKD